jgi:hypothetical protein
MNLACRISYQGKLSGEMPFYMMPFVFQSAPLMTWDGIGGAKTIRGIKRNRVVGDGFLFGNLEVRGKILRFSAFNQNIYIALSVFTDAGMIIQKYTFDVSGMPAELPGDLPGNIIDQDVKEVPHIGIGGGAHFALNQNFIITVDNGFASKSEDGYRGLYMNMKYLF